MIKKLSKKELEVLFSSLNSEYDNYKAKGLNLDMSRGKPGALQLDLSEGMLSAISKNEDCFSEDGTDCRNYGVLDGIIEAKKMFAELMELSVKNVLVGNNSSLNLMYDSIARAMLFGVYGSEKAWSKYEKIKFLCPVPGYDRHFTICETFGIEMINVHMTEEGPDMDVVEKLVAEDDSIKGIWCVPKYSNPDGITYSDAVVKRFANLNPKAKDFRIFWDNAYALHSFNETDDKLLNIMDELKKTGKEDMVFMYLSTSKVSFPGSGIAAMGCSENNLALIKKQMFPQTIGPNKINQLYHMRFFKNADGVKMHMKKHAAIIKPLFEVAIDMLKKELGDEDIATWVEPKGGYFISLNVMNGCAKRSIELLKGIGVTMTPAGATFPYGKDPNDSNIRIAPTYPPITELEQAMKMLCLCVKIAAVEKLLKQ